MIPRDPPGFSVVIPTHQRRASLERVLAGLAVQAYPRPLLDVIVICDGCTDGTLAMLRRTQYPFTLRVLEQSNQGPAAARNRGLASARGPFVLFLDDDVIPSPCLLAEHVNAHDGARDRVVIGPLLSAFPPRRPWVRWEMETLARVYDRLGTEGWPVTWRQFHTGNASLRLEHLSRVSGFNPDFRRAEDIELGRRLKALGLRFMFHRPAVTNHIADRPFRSWLGNAYEYGRADVAIARIWNDPVIMEVKAREFYNRHRVTRLAVRWGLRRPWMGAVVPPVVRSSARLALLARRPDLALKAYSGIFDLAYWYGVRDALGGSEAAERLLKQVAPRPAEVRP